MLVGVGDVRENDRRNEMVGYEKREEKVRKGREEEIAPPVMGREFMERVKHLRLKDRAWKQEKSEESSSREVRA